MDPRQRSLLDTAIGLMVIGLSFLAILVMTNGCATFTPALQAVGTVVARCAEPTVRKTAIELYPKANTILADNGCEECWEQGLTLLFQDKARSLVNSGKVIAKEAAVSLAEQALACAVREIFGQAFHAASIAPDDKVSRVKASRADEFIKERGYSFR